MSNIKMLDEKALQKIYRNSDKLVFNNRSRIITDGLFTIKNHSHVKFSTETLGNIFPKIKKDNIREYKNFNTVLNKPDPVCCYKKTCIIVEGKKDKKQFRVYKMTNSDNILAIYELYSKYFYEFLYAYNDFKIICYNKETREKSNFMVMGVRYYNTLTEAMENNFLVHE